MVLLISFYKFLQVSLKIGGEGRVRDWVMKKILKY